MRILHLILPFAIYRTVCSSPVPPNSIKSRAELPLLVLLLTFVALLFVLFFTKWLYIIRRRQAKRTGGSRTTLRSGWYDNFSTSSSRFGRFFVGSGDVKSGFLIGLLGSPTWETRYSAVIVGRHSLLGEPSVSSRKSASGLSLSQYSKSFSSPCCASVPEETIPVVSDTTPMSPPSPAVTTNRSPLLSDSEYIHLLNSRLSSAFPLGVPPLVNSSPTNPCKKDIGRKSSRTSSIANRRTIQAAYPLSPRQDSSNLAANNQPSTSSIRTPSQAPKPTDAASLDTMGVYIRAQRSFQNQETQRRLKSLSVDVPIPTNLVQRFESTLTSINEHFSNDMQPQPVDTTAKPFAPSLRSKATHSKHFLSLPSYRSSQKIGPSPLRAMILPPDTHPDSFQPFSSNRHNQLWPPTHDAIDIDPAENLVVDRSKNVQLSSTQTPGPKSTDADSLLDLMSELAQETSAWDPNVFMDENFKMLIAHPKPQAVLKENTVRPRRRSWRSSRHRKVQHVFTTLEDIPEVDVTEMMPTSTGDTFIHSFWSNEDDRQFLISINAR